MITDEQSVGSKVVLGANTRTDGLKMKPMKTLQGPRSVVFFSRILQKMASWHLPFSIPFAFFLTPRPQPQDDDDWALVFHQCKIARRIPKAGEKRNILNSDT